MEYNFFFVYCDVIMKIVNFFSIPCVLLCFSSNYFVLRIARYNEYITEKPMPVAGWSKSWVCVCSLAGIGVGIPPRAWISVFSE